MKSAKKIVYSLVVIIILVLPMIFTNVKSNYASDLDNRMLQEFPQDINKISSSTLEKYFKDRVGFRTYLITLYQEICSAFFNILVHPTYMYGKNGQIYTDMDLQNFQHLDVGNYPDLFCEFVKNMQNVSNTMGADFYFIMPPNKESVYYEDYTEGYNINEKMPSRTELISNGLINKGVSYVDLLMPFCLEKSNIKLYNDKYDAGHFNANGMKLTCKLLYDRILSNNPELKIWDEEYYNETSIMQKYLMQSRFVINEYIPHYDINMSNCIDESELLSGILGYDQCFRYINEDNKGGKKLLIIGDSYAGVDNGMERYFYPYFYEVNRIHKDYIDNYLYCISVLEPDIVVFEATERVLNGTSQKYTEKVMKQNHYSILENVNTSIKCTRIDNDVQVVYSGKRYDGSDGTSYLLYCVKLDGNNPDSLIAVLNGKEYVARKLEDGWIFAYRQEDLGDSYQADYYRIDNVV